MKNNTLNSKKFIKSFSLEYYEGLDFSLDKTNKILDNSIITNRDHWDKNIEKKLSYVLKRYKKENKI